MKSMRELISLMEGVVAVPGINVPLNELSKDTLKSYSKERGKDIRADLQSASDAKEMSADSSKHGDTKKSAAWDDEADWLTKRAEKGAGNVAKATSKIAAKKDVDESALNEKSKSEKQARFMAACAHDADYDSCPPKKVAKEFNKADTGTEQLSKAMKESFIDEDDVMENMTDYDEEFIGSAIRDMYPTATSRDELMSMVAGQTGYGGNPDFERVFDAQLDKVLGREDTDFPNDDENAPELDSEFDSEFDGFDDMSADADALASAGHGSDEDYGGDEFPMEDLQNGYNDINMADGDDFFPNGADSPVVTDVGPSGARQGDNPEQKKMQVAEVHKELVLGYRNYLKESSVAQKKKLNESAVVSDIRMEDYHDTAHADTNTVDFDGSLSMSANVLAKDGNVIDIGYPVDITATADIDWETDEDPTGWNYSTDQPTYTSYTTAVFGNITVSSVTFTPNSEFILNNEETDLATVRQYVDSHVLKQLLNPEAYIPVMNQLFIKAVENLEPPDGSDDFEEPERDW